MLGAVPGCAALLSQGLVLDDNRSNAAMALAFNSTACTYRFQRPLAFYECRLLQLQWWRPANSLRCVQLTDQAAPSLVTCAGRAVLVAILRSVACSGVFGRLDVFEREHWILPQVGGTPLNKPQDHATSSAGYTIIGHSGHWAQWAMSD